jgi:hypothetical protein
MLTWSASAQSSNPNYSEDEGESDDFQKRPHGKSRAPAVEEEDEEEYLEEEDEELAEEAGDGLLLLYVVLVLCVLGFLWYGWGFFSSDSGDGSGDGSGLDDLLE